MLASCKFVTASAIRTHAPACCSVCGIARRFACCSRTAELGNSRSFSRTANRACLLLQRGQVSAPSSLELMDKKLPVDTSSFVSAPNSLRLAWQSAPNGAWDVEIRLPNWPNRFIDFTGDTLYLWLYSASRHPRSRSAADLPSRHDQRLQRAPEAGRVRARSVCGQMDARRDSSGALQDCIHSSV